VVNQPMLLVLSVYHFFNTISIKILRLKWCKDSMFILYAVEIFLFRFNSWLSTIYLAHKCPQMALLYSSATTRTGFNALITRPLPSLLHKFTCNNPRTCYGPVYRTSLIWHELARELLVYWWNIVAILGGNLNYIASFV